MTEEMKRERDEERERATETLLLSKLKNQFEVRTPLNIIIKSEFCVVQVYKYTMSITIDQSIRPYSHAHIMCRK